MKRQYRRVESPEGEQVAVVTISLSARASKEKVDAQMATLGYEPVEDRDGDDSPPTASSGDDSQSFPRALRPLGRKKAFAPAPTPRNAAAPAPTPRNAAAPAPTLRNAAAPAPERQSVPSGVVLQRTAPHGPAATDVQSGTVIREPPVEADQRDMSVATPVVARPSAVQNVLVIAIAAGLWLVVLDRIGIALLGHSPWCGLYGLWTLWALNSLAAAVIALCIVLVSKATRFAVGWRRYVLPGVLAAGMTFVLGRPLFHAMTEAGGMLAPLAGMAALATPLLVGIFVGAFSPRPRRWWHLAPWALASLGAAVVDATVFPGLMPTAHVVEYAATVLFSCWGIGIPAALAVTKMRKPRLAIGLGTAVLTSGAAIMMVDTGAPAALSPVFQRVMRRIPTGAPDGVLANALRSPFPFQDPPAAKPSEPKARSVVLITVDALRADAILSAPERGSYMQRGDTPFLDAWLPKTSRFVNAASNGTATIESMRMLTRGVYFHDAQVGAGMAHVGTVTDTRTAAIVPPWMLVDWLYGADLSNFDRIELYDLERQESQVEQFIDVVGQSPDDPFFVWTHFFCTHQPFYTDEGPGQLALLGPSEIDRLAPMYREAVMWLDSQLASMIGAIERAGRADSTVVIIAADHGEHVGDGLLMGHGDALHRADFHVPLVVFAPGMEGRVIEAPVSNLDILPTITELVGAPPQPAQHGHSLVPLMRDRSVTPKRSSYLYNHDLRLYGIVTERDFLYYDSAVGSFYRYPAETGMSFDRGNVFGDAPEIERDLMNRLAWIAPEPFSEDLDGAAQQLLIDRLRRVDQSTTDQELSALMRMASSRPGKFDEAVAVAVSNAGTPSRKARLFAGIQFSNPNVWNPRVREWLMSSLETLAEAETVQALVDHSVIVNLGGPTIIQRLLKLDVVYEHDLLLKWMLLLQKWPKGAGFVGVYDRMRLELEKEGSLSNRQVRLILDGIAKTSVAAQRGGKAIDSLAGWVRGLLDSDVRGIAQRACKALGSIGSSDVDVVRLQEIALDVTRPPTVRRAALLAAAQLEPDSSEAFATRLASDPLVAPAAFEVLAQFGDYDTVNMLKETAANAESKLKRDLASQAAQTLWGRILREKEQEKH